MRTSMWSASSSAGGRVCGVTSSSWSLGPSVSASRTTTQPLGVLHVVTSTFVPGLVRRVRRVRGSRTARTGSAGLAVEQAAEDARRVEARARTASRSSRRARRALRCGSRRGTRSRRSAGTATAPRRSGARVRASSRRRATAAPTAPERSPSSVVSITGGLSGGEEVRLSSGSTIWSTNGWPSRSPRPPPTMIASRSSRFCADARPRPSAQAASSMSSRLSSCRPSSARSR